MLEKEWVPQLHEYLNELFGSVCSKQVAIVCAIGSNMRQPGFLGQAATALAQAGVNILCVAQSTRQTNMQFLVERSDFVLAQQVLHRALCELE
jgi:aspartate kinase